MAKIDVLIPTCARPAALAVTLTSLAAPVCRDFRVVVSDQTEDGAVTDSGEVTAVIRVLRLHGHSVEVFHHLPRRGMAEQRQFLLDHADAPVRSTRPDILPLETSHVDTRHQRRVS